MKAGLELPGGGLFPSKERVDRFGLDRIGWPTFVEAPGGGVIRNPLLELSLSGGPNVIEEVRNNWSKTVFLFRALWGWSGPPEAWADEFRKDLARYDLTSKPGVHPARQCALDADLEVDNPDWIRRALGRLLEVLPGRGLTWSFQPHKGGIMSPALVDFINGQRWLTVAPFKYFNDMQPCSERWVVEDLRAAGIADAKILVWYDRFESGFDGFLYGI